MNSKYKTVIERNYFDMICRAYTTEFTEDTCYPWLFEIDAPNGKTRCYCGIPNRCETSKSALKRAWYRAKEIRESLGE